VGGVVRSPRCLKERLAPWVAQPYGNQNNASTFFSIRFYMDTNNPKSAQDIAQEAWEACSKAQQRWITHVYKARKDELDGRCSERETKAALDGDIPRDFNTRVLPQTLIVNIGQILTPYGVLAVNPDSSIMEDLNTIAKAVRAEIMANPSVREISVDKIAEATSYEEATTSLLLSDLGRTRLGSQFTQRSGLQYNFDAFYAFEGDIEPYLAEQFLPDKQEEAPKPTPREHPFVIRPVFQSRIASVIDSFCFVLMPFSTDWSKQVYGDLLKPALDSAGYNCLRFTTGQFVMSPEGARKTPRLLAILG